MAKKKTFPRKSKNQEATAIDSAQEDDALDDDDVLLEQLAPSSARSGGEQQMSSARVIVVGMGLVGVGMLGFYHIPGLMADDVKGDRFINAFYCAAITLTT